MARHWTNQQSERRDIVGVTQLASWLFFLFLPSLFFFFFLWLRSALRLFEFDSLLTKGQRQTRRADLCNNREQICALFTVPQDRHKESVSANLQSSEV